MKLRSKLLYTLIIGLIIVFGANVALAGGVGITLVGDDELEVHNILAPAKRVDTLYRMGEDRIIIKYGGCQLIPVGEGDSMHPMVAEGHYILITTDYEPADIVVGDFIVVNGLAGRYFHQVVGVKQDDNGLVFTTRGINNYEDDLLPVFEQDIAGVAIAVIW